MIQMKEKVAKFFKQKLQLIKFYMNIAVSFFCNFCRFLFSRKLPCQIWDLEFERKKWRWEFSCKRNPLMNNSLWEIILQQQLRQRFRRRSQVFEISMVIWKHIVFLKYCLANSEVNDSKERTWLWGFPCLNSYCLFFVEKQVWFRKTNFPNLVSFFSGNFLAFWNDPAKSDFNLT